MYKLFLINRYLRKRLIIFNRYNRTRIFRKPLGQRPRPASDFKHNIITMNISHLQQYPHQFMSNALATCIFINHDFMQTEQPRSACGGESRDHT